MIKYSYLIVFVQMKNSFVYLSANCPNGDYKVPMGGQTCADYLKSGPAFCYTPSNEKLCCGSCKKFATGIKGEKNEYLEKIKNEKIKNNEKLWEICIR